MHIFDNVYCYIDVNNGSAFENAGGCLSLTNKVTHIYTISLHAHLRCRKGEQIR